MARKTIERRAVQVCQLCHRHKIRCEIHIKGTACVRCKETGETCELRSRKAYSTRKKKATSRSARSNSSFVPEGNAISCGEGGYSNGNTPEEENSQSDLIVATIVNHANSDTNTTPLFVGDQHGIAALLETDRSTTFGKKHFMVPTATAQLLEPDDLQYLKMKDCFTLPDADVCESLVQCYFEFVHSTFPVLDAKAFLDAYIKSGVQAINLLLLWSMFSIATSYIHEQLLRRLGFRTKKEVKLLFDLSHENDKIVLVQSALLIGFWFSDAEDVFQSWHWTGVAISLAQTLGLHRDPDRRDKNTSISDQQRMLWRQIWWSCVVRDVWLSLGMGRPLRISLDDCDCPRPSRIDTHAAFEDITGSGFATGLPSDMKEVTKSWLALVELSMQLREVLRSRSRLGTESLSIEHMKQLATRIDDCQDEKVSVGLSTPPVLNLLAYHLRLHQQSTLIAIFRPDRDQCLQYLHHEKRDSWKAFAKDRVRNAAKTTNEVLENMMATGLHKYASPMSIPLIAPAATYWLAESKSKNSLRSQIGNRNLDLCLLFLTEVEDSYPAATIIHKLFSSARSNHDLLPQSNNLETSPASKTVPDGNSSIIAISPSQHSGSTGSEIFEEFIADPIFAFPFQAPDLAQPQNIGINSQFEFGEFLQGEAGSNLVFQHRL